MCTTVHKIKPSCSLLSLYRITLDINRGKSSDKMNNLSLAWITKLKVSPSVQMRECLNDEPSQQAGSPVDSLMTAPSRMPRADLGSPPLLCHRGARAPPPKGPHSHSDTEHSSQTAAAHLQAQHCGLYKQ